MRCRLLGLIVVATLPFLVLAAEPPRAVYHRDGFAGRQPVWVIAESNVTSDEKDHRIVTDRYYNAPSSEYLKIEAKPTGQGADAEFIHYAYDTPKTPVAPADGTPASASVWVRAYRPGIQLRARVRLPKERDPANPDAELAVLMVGDSYPDERVRSWHRLTLGNPAETLQKQLPVLRSQLKREVDTTGAYIDRLVLNVYAGPGATEVWIDDLDIGPCLPDPAKPRIVGVPASRTAVAALHPYAVTFNSGRILIDNKPFFMRAIRWTDCPLKELRDAGFNTVALSSEAESAVIEEAVRNGLMVIGGVPLAGTPQPNETISTLERDADRLAEHFRRFRSGDGVLMWDLGMNRTTEQLPAVTRTANALREYDSRRPRSVNLWDGFSAYSEQIDVISSHRWPLHTGLELERYREWLLQRRALSAPLKLHTTWIQAHAPEWYTASVNAPQTGSLTSPIGPQPEQIRLLTYLSLACGYRGIGFWNDRWLANSHFGRDRFIEVFLLNCELQLLEPVLFASEDVETTWETTSDPNVKAAVIRGRKGIIVLPVWVGPGSQCVPPQAAVDGLVIKVRQVPDGYDPWVLTPATYENLHSAGKVRQVPGGTEITIPKFDLASVVVFTNDTAPDGLIVRWQDNIRNTFGKDAARYAREQATEIYNKVLAVHQQLESLAPPVNGANDLLEQARTSVRLSAKAFDNGQNDVAYREARASLRPLRVLMRDHWQNAVTTLSAPTASPYAVGFYTLPKHWELARQMRAAKPGANVLPYGGFELSEPAPPEGAAVHSLPGWTNRQTSLDGATMVASIVNIDDTNRGKPAVGLQLGKNCLRLQVQTRKTLLKDARPPLALERTAVAAESPAAAVAPGSWVRVSFWANVPQPITATADGAVVFDSAGGEPLAVRIPLTNGWQRFNLYRQAPASGQMRVTFALTGFGTAYFDDVKIEPMLGASESQRPDAAAGGVPGVVTGRK